MAGARAYIWPGMQQKVPHRRPYGAKVSLGLAVVAVAAALPALVLPVVPGLIGSVALAAAAGWWAWRALMMPVRRIARATERIYDQEDYATRLRCDGHGEFRFVAARTDQPSDPAQR